MKTQPPNENRRSKRPAGGPSSAAPKAPAKGGPDPAAHEYSVISLIREIKEGRRDPRLLSSDSRQACVAHLGSEGMSVPEIAQFLRCSDRTITRDRKALQEAARVEYDPTLVGIMVGRLMLDADNACTRLRRIGRDKGCSAAVRADIERNCFDILDRLLQRLQSIGYLPSGNTVPQADPGSAANHETMALLADLIEKHNPHRPATVQALRSIAELVAPGAPLLQGEQP